MKTTRFLLAACGAAILCGCGQDVGWVIKPVPLDETLRETVIAADPGLFVSDKIAVLDVDGLLMNRRATGWMMPGENPVSLFVEKLDRAESDPNVRAVVVRINSPGGAVTASDVMYRRLVRFRAARPGVPVVAVIEDVGASGGYYVACGADTILAHPTSVTGSIGVIVQTVSFAGTMRMIGIDAKAVTSGARKDMASPLKPLDEKDLAILQGIVDQYYRRFLQVVESARPNLKPDQVRALADGRVYTGEQAKDNGLVDGLGYVDDAVLMAKKRSARARVKLVMYHRPLGYRANVYSAAPNLAPQVNLLNIDLPGVLSLAQPEFLYLWTGRATGSP
ncbi:MAG TPA: signal peptide peptidase SppA [Vicinamibacterales bacterium]|nr:signal peptide peptidase SppA [Vicinamibacterales bacterium]